MYKIMANIRLQTILKTKVQEILQFKLDRYLSVVYDYHRYYILKYLKN